MNIIRFLKERGITTQIVYYGTNDMATGFEVKNIVENYRLIDNYIEKIQVQITTIDEYIDYLYLHCLVKYDDVVPLVREDLRELFSEQLKIFKEKYQKYQKVDLIRFVKDNYKKILKYDYKGLYIKADIVDYTIGFIIEFCSSDDEAIKYIIKNFSYKIYDNFGSFKKIFNKSSELCYYNILLSENLLKKDIIFRMNEIKDVLCCLKAQNLELYNKKLKILINIVKEKDFSSTKSNVMNTYFELKDFLKVLSGLGAKEYYEFEKELKIQEVLLNEHLKEHGQSTSFEINIKPIVEVLENSKKEWYTKSLILTHSHDKKNKRKLITNLEYAYKYFERSQISDLVTTNMETDSIFTYSVINNLSLSMLYNKYSINYMLKDDEKLNDLLAFVYMGICNYFPKDSLYFDYKKFEDDINMLFDSIKELKNAYSAKNEIKIKWKTYGVEMLLCGIIEKILRNVFYEKMKKEKYVNSKYITLGSLLDSQELKKELGTFNCECIEFYLLNRKGVGQNNRNDFSHYSENIYDKFTYDILLEELFILLTISNILLINSSK